MPDRADLPFGSWQTAVDLNGTTLIKCGFGDWRIIPKYWFEEDDLKDVLDANSHLCRSDLM